MRDNQRRAAKRLLKMTKSDEIFWHVHLTTAFTQVGDATFAVSYEHQSGGANLSVRVNGRESMTTIAGDLGHRLYVQATLHQRRKYLDEKPIPF